jgi:hypothetical protein
VIAVNDAALRAPWTDVLFFGDDRWFDWHADELAAYGGLIVTRHMSLVRNRRVHVVKPSTRDGAISTNPGAIAWNGSSGACAINLAALFGAARIVLFGFDGRVISDDELRDLRARGVDATRSNWHSKHWENVARTKRRNRQQPATVEQWDAVQGQHIEAHNLGFGPVAKALAEQGIECVNATPKSGIKAFPVVSVETGIAMAKEVSR